MGMKPGTISLRSEKIFERLRDAVDDYDRVTQWMKDAPRDSYERKQHRWRQWEIKRRMNRYVLTLVRRKLLEMES